MAYDRTLLASAKSIREWLDIAGQGADMRLTASVPYSAIEAFEADNRSRLYFRVAGFDDLPAWHGSIPMFQSTPKYSLSEIWKRSSYPSPK